MESLRQQAEELPQGPGVYRFDDSAGNALYIGKAINIRRRVFQHLDRPMREGLLNGAVSVEAFESDDENSALSLERQLINRYRPRRNIRLPGRPLMLCVSDDPFPRLVLTRSGPEKGWLSFGPYENAGQARRLLETLEATFQIRTCTGQKPGRPQTPCLDYYLGRCSAPCADFVSEAEYRKQIDSALSVLRGDSDNLIAELEEEMSSASQKQHYERASVLRDRIQSLNKLTGRNYAVGGGSYDVIALARDEERALIDLRRIRRDQVVDVTRLRLEVDREISDEEIIRQFIVDHAGELDNNLVLATEIADPDEFSLWRERPLKLIYPKRGAKRRVLETAEQGAKRALARPGAEPEGNPLDALEELQSLLSLPELPLTVECFDISNIGARQTTGGIVRMTAGKLFENRALKLAERDKPNDVAAIGELCKRRMEMESFGERPDLLIIDGGRGQLNRAARVMAPWIEAGMAIASLAKREELVFLPGKSEPLRPEGKALRLLQRLRDQTHNTAISAHRRRRDRATIASPLDRIDGIGPARRKALLEHFGSLDNVLSASQEELEAVLPRRVAERLKQAL